MIDFKENIKIEKIKKTSKKWKNWWYVYNDKDIYWTKYNEFWKSKTKYASGNLWPSKEIAEEKANKYISENIFEMLRLKLEYLGAFPEEE